MKRRTSLLGLAFAALMALAIGQRWLPADLHAFNQSAQTAAAGQIHFPAEEQRAIGATLELVNAGGPFPYGKDGSEFSNREGRLPQQGSGYYREYTVATAGAPDRGARRLVAGRAGEIYYTRDHYRTFIRLN
jgi:ribonuclease T1